VAGSVDDHGGDAVLGQEPGERAVAAPDVDHPCTGFGGQAPRDVGVDVGAGREASGGRLVGREAVRVGVVVTGQWLGAHGLTV
jgi:hypothetical protein